MKTLRTFDEGKRYSVGLLHWLFTAKQGQSPCRFDACNPQNRKAVCLRSRADPGQVGSYLQAKEGKVQISAEFQRFGGKPCRQRKILRILT